MKKVILAVITASFLFIPLLRAEETPISGEEIDRILIQVYYLQESLFAGHPESELYYNAIESLLRDCIERYPASVTLHRELQRLPLMRPGTGLGEREAIYDSLRTVYQALMEVNPRSPEFTYLYARLLDNPDERLVLGEEVLKRNRKNYWRLMITGDALIMQEKYEDALGVYLEAADADSTRPEAYRALVDVYRVTGDNQGLYDAARTGYRVTVDPFLRDGYYNLAKIAAYRLDRPDLRLELERELFLEVPAEDEQGVADRVARLQGLAIGFWRSDMPDSAVGYLDFAYRLALPLGKKVINDVLYYTAFIEADRGDNERALDLISEMAENGYINYGQLLADEQLAVLADEPRFQMMIDGMKAATRSLVLAERIEDPQPAPDFTLADLEGSAVSLSDLKGKPVFIDFWGITCGPCFASMPVLEEFYNDHKDEIYLYGIESWNATPERCVEVLSENKATYPSLLGSPEVLEAYGIRGVPHLIVLDERGRIVFSHIGYSPNLADRLEWWLEDLQ